MHPRWPQHAILNESRVFFSGSVVLANFVPRRSENSRIPFNIFTFLILPMVTLTLYKEVARIKSLSNWKGWFKFRQVSGSYPWIQATFYISQKASAPSLHPPTHHLEVESWATPHSSVSGPTVSGWAFSGPKKSSSSNSLYYTPLLRHVPAVQIFRNVGTWEDPIGARSHGGLPIASKSLVPHTRPRTNHSQTQ